MLTIACASPASKFNIKTPKVIKKARSIQKRRDQQLKTVVDDITDIARKEVERMSDLVQDFIGDSSENPIVVKDLSGYKSDDEEISL